MQWTGWFDGATKRTNPGERGLGALLRAPNGQEFEIAEALDVGTNNTAEYLALIRLLETAHAQGARQLIVYGDSQLVINQVSGRWLIAAKDLVPLARRATELMKAIGDVRLQWIPREENERADELSKRALGQGASTAVDEGEWAKQLTVIAGPFGLSAVALGKKLDLAKFRENGKPTALAVSLGVALRVENAFGHTNYWHRKRLPAALREIHLLD